MPELVYSKSTGLERNITLILVSEFMEFRKKVERCICNAVTWRMTMTLSLSKHWFAPASWTYKELLEFHVQRCCHTMKREKSFTRDCSIKYECLNPIFNLKMCQHQLDEEWTMSWGKIWSEVQSNLKKHIHDLVFKKNFDIEHAKQSFSYESNKLLPHRKYFLLSKTRGGWQKL